MISGPPISSAAIYDGGRVRLIGLDPSNAAPTIMRSTLFISREGVPFIGREAIDRFTEGNVGREIEYQWRYIGETEVTLAEFGTVMQALYAVVDANTPGRLFQSLKSHLRDGGFSGTDVFGVRYTLEQLIAVVLRMILERVEAELGQKVTGMVIGRPVHYAHDPEHDALALERMRAACEVAGLPPFDFLPEPTAAATPTPPASTASSASWCSTSAAARLDVTIITRWTAAAAQRCSPPTACRSAATSWTGASSWARPCRTLAPAQPSARAAWRCPPACLTTSASGRRSSS